jgi:ribose 5-phosphate isomerase RpiB
MEENNFYKLSEDILNLIKTKKFESWNAGLSSTERKNLKRVCKVLDSLSELNSFNVKTETEHFFINLRMLIIDFMKESGFESRINTKDKYTFKKIK